MKREPDDKLYIVMPAYNEEDNIEAVVESWYTFLKGKHSSSRLVVADSGSTDRTHDILKKFKKTHPQLLILSNTDKQHGPKVLALYKYAIENKADYIFQTDSDGQTNPEEFNDFWRLRHDYDAIIGHRVSRGDGKTRAFVERIVCSLLKLFFDVSVPDANAPFRLMKSTIVSKYIDRFPSDYSIPNIILTAYFTRFKETITFKTVSFEPRKSGTNSINIKKIFKIGRSAVLSFFSFRKDMKKTDPKLANQILRHKIATLLILISFSVATLLIATMSPSHPWNRGETATDSSVFLTIGRQMKTGLQPYRDTFDHKGPVLFLINYLGVLINQNSGILVFECLAIFISFVAMYKIARLKCANRLLSVVLTFISMTLYLTINKTERGNLTEEYAMPLIVVSLYVFLSYFINKKTTSSRVFIAGFCFGVVALLRVNMVASWVVLCVAVFLRNLFKKDYRTLGKYVLSFALGSAFIIVPIVIWMIANGILGDFFEDYLLFNTAYASSAGNTSSIFSTAMHFLSMEMVTLTILLCTVLLVSSKQKRIWIIYLLSFAASVVAVAMSGRIYPHYGIILVPFTIFPLAFFCARLLEAERQGTLVSAFVVIIAMLFYTPWCDLINSAQESFKQRHIGETVTESLAKSCEIIESLTKPEDRITVYGNRNVIYLYCNRLPINKYSYQYPIGEVRSNILDEYYSDLSTTLPKVIVVQAGQNDERMTAFVKTNNYKTEWREASGNGTIIYSRAN